MTKKDPLVSVIIPCYSEGRILEETVNSVLSQSYNNYEIIIVKDYFKHDETISVCEKVEKLNKVEVYYLKSQKFTSGARNYGIKNSKGEIIFRER